MIIFSVMYVYISTFQPFFPVKDLHRNEITDTCLPLSLSTPCLYLPLIYLSTSSAFPGFSVSVSASVSFSASICPLSASYTSGSHLPLPFIWLCLPFSCLSVCLSSWHLSVCLPLILASVCLPLSLSSVCLSVCDRCSPLSVRQCCMYLPAGAVRRPRSVWQKGSRSGACRACA